MGNCLDEDPDSYTRIMDGKIWIQSIWFIARGAAGLKGLDYANKIFGPLGSRALYYLTKCLIESV